MKFYCKYLLIFVAALITGFIFHLALFYFNLGTPNAQEKYLNEWFEKKDAYAGSINGKKLFFISGSNTLFGVDTEKIEQSLHISTVNYGTHVGVKYYTLHRAKKYIHSGDIVILPLEYSFYIYHNNNIEREYALYILGYDKAFFSNLTLYQKFIFISQTDTIDLLKLAVRKYFPKAPNDSAYDAKYLNTNGDMTNYSTKKQMTCEYMLTLIPDRVFKEAPLTPDSKEELTNFINYCHNNNITLYSAWPNYLWRDKAFSENDLESIHTIEKFYREHNVEILGDYTDCLYDADLFYDSTYHLNADGKRIHTEYLIQLLRDKVHK